MGRAATKSVARVYPEVNSKLGPSWYEYGRCKFRLNSPARPLIRGHRQPAGAMGHPGPLRDRKESRPGQVLGGTRVLFCCAAVR